MKILPTPLSGLKQVALSPFEDERGQFTRLFCANELQEILDARKIVQTNLSTNTFAGTIRGMHFQKPPKQEGKLITCVTGKVWDVAVDLRKDSPTFLQWFGTELSAANRMAIYIPEGFAHGFQALEPNSSLLYHHTEFYAPEVQDGLRFDDPKLAIEWKMPPVHVSSRDASYPLLDHHFKGM